MGTSEKREHRRLAVKLDLSCRKLGSLQQKVYTGSTVNVSSGGLYFQTADDTFRQGNMLKVELSIPPTAGLLEFGGRISGLAKVLRTYDNFTDANLSPGSYGVALQFYRSPKLCM